MKHWTIIFLGLFFLGACSENSVSEHIKATKILQVKLGMSKNDVIEILKEPVRKYSKNHQGYTTFQFTEEHKCNYPMLWVHFDSLGVREVYAKYYDWIDDSGIYVLIKDSKTNEEYRWGEESLNNYFN